MCSADHKLLCRKGEHNNAIHNENKYYTLLFFGARDSRARALFHYIILVFTMYLCMTFCDDGRFDFAKHYYILCVFTIQYICWLAKCLILF